MVLVTKLLVVLQIMITLVAPALYAIEHEDTAKCQNCSKSLALMHVCWDLASWLCDDCYQQCAVCPCLSIFAEMDRGAFSCSMCGEPASPSNNPWNPGRRVAESDYKYCEWVAHVHSKEYSICDKCMDMLHSAASL